MSDWKPTRWANNDRDAKKLWSAGYTPSELLDQNASGSSYSGQFADLSATNTYADWAISTEEAQRSPIKLLHNILASGWVTVEIQNPDEEHALEKIQLRTTAEKLEIIKDIFGISLSQLAKILRTSRPSIYSWLEGEEPREATEQRIREIYGYAEHWREINQYHFSPAPLFRQPLGNSLSMLDRLTKANLNDEEIENGLTSILELMQRRRERMDRSKHKTKNSSLSESEVMQHRHNLTQTIGSIE